MSFALQRFCKGNCLERVSVLLDTRLHIPQANVNGCHSDVPSTTCNSGENPELAAEGIPVSDGHRSWASSDAPRAKPLKRDSNTFIEAWNGHMKVFVPRQDAVPTEESGVYLVTGVRKSLFPFLAFFCV